LEVISSLWWGELERWFNECSVYLLLLDLFISDCRDIVGRILWTSDQLVAETKFSYIRSATTDVELHFGIVILSSGYCVALDIYLIDILSFPVWTPRYIELLLPWFSCVSVVNSRERTNKLTAAISFQIFFHYSSSSFTKFSFNFRFY